MGLLGKFMGNAPAKKATDDILLLMAMMMMSSADGVLEGSEIAALEQYINTLPEYKDNPNFDKQMAEARKAMSKFPRPRDAIKALGDISSPAVKKKTFVLAADIAMSSGEVDEAEEELLEAMQRVLGI
ncbi:MAG: TerB family tellurite resistance protein, partial [Kofleriaceae bacterium]|nr:TerB family tellurite resistance protein [Kofleriaceae bacterium]